MSQKRLMGWQKATALVPLALLSSAWTASLTVTATAATDEPTTLPDGTPVPSGAIESPASLSQPGSVAPGVPTGAGGSIVASASTNGIPSAALAAYQRAAQVMSSADESCNLSWQLVAAIGRIESDHGRYGGNTLTTDGVSTPGIYGIPLDGSDGTARITDTDGGQYDNDPVLDRAVGPMQFIPSTWSVVGVDADGDGVRNPQDIDDAALAAAVYLCSGEEDLATVAGQRSAVWRYNHSNEYVDLVLAVMQAYADGDFAAVPNSTPSSVVFTPVDPAGSGSTRAGRDGDGPRASKPGTDKPGRNGGEPTGKPRGGNDGDDNNDNGGEVEPPLAEEPGTGGDPTQPVKDAGKKVEETVKETLSPLEKAKATCQAEFTADEIKLLGGLDACGKAVLNKGLPAVKAQLAALLDNAVGGVIG